MRLSEMLTVSNSTVHALVIHDIVLLDKIFTFLCTCNYV